MWLTEDKLERSSDTGKTCLDDPDVSCGFGQMWCSVVLLFLMGRNLSAAMQSFQWRVSVSVLLSSQNVPNVQKWNLNKISGSRTPLVTAGKTKSNLHFLVWNMTYFWHFLLKQRCHNEITRGALGQHKVLPGWVSKRMHVKTNTCKAEASASFLKQCVVVTGETLRVPVLWWWSVWRVSSKVKQDPAVAPFSRVLWGCAHAYGCFRIRLL